MGAVSSRRDGRSDLFLACLTHSADSRWFDFLARKAQHVSSHLDKEVFCDSLLGFADTTIASRSRTIPRPPGTRSPRGRSCVCNLSSLRQLAPSFTQS
ncbi:hypothetical protein COMA2_250025 [Candidatus Nitrospira nitrificans]|uniref:Uncharacterized protein n=1 Tax=Candidatus Nitrospira nitrificans TaxID=1742973 RepID=A0A0S4LGP8_9BACT|nr:hypothetical protein COMA2_250025 [Candidatus Nitrospira nitrificans]